MRVISKGMLREFWEERPDSEKPLTHWHTITKRADWHNFADVRADFPHADQVGEFTVFNVKGNKYRLVTQIRYDWHIVFTLHVFTHKEYDDWTAEQRSG